MVKWCPRQFLGWADGTSASVSTPSPTPSGHSAYVQQWMTGVQYSLTNNDFGGHQLRWQPRRSRSLAIPEWNELPVSALALGTSLTSRCPIRSLARLLPVDAGSANPTVQRGQLLLPFPEYCSVTEAQPAVGGSTYNALQATYTHRWHSRAGAQRFLTPIRNSWTTSRELPDGHSQVQGVPCGIPTIWLAERSVDASDLTHSLVISHNYELPFGKGKQFGGDWNRPMNAVLGAGNGAGSSRRIQGCLFPSLRRKTIPAVFGFNQRPNRVPGVSPVPQNQSITIGSMQRPFRNPPHLHLETPPDSCRPACPGFVNWDMGLQKWWNITETMRFQFRFELFNAFNHPNFFTPDTNLGDFNPIPAINISGG